MKKSRKSIISAMVALALILTGTGYAYWTDTLNVTTKATTGEFEVTFVDLGLYAQYDNETRKGGWSIVDGIDRKDSKGFIPDEYFMRGNSDYNSIAKEGSIEDYYAEAGKYNNINFDAELVDAEKLKKDFMGTYGVTTLSSDTIEITVNNMYPGYAQAFRSDILNVGTLAAKLTNMKFSVAALDNMALQKDMLGIAVLVNREAYNPAEPDANTFGLCTAANKISKISSKDFFRVGGVDFLRLSAIEKMGTKALMDVLKNNMLYAQPGSDNRLDIFLAVAMDPDAEGKYTTGSTAVMANKDDSESQNNGAVITIEMLWDQFNVGVDTKKANILEDQNTKKW